MKIIIQTLTLAMLMILASPMLAAENESSADKPMAQQMEKTHSYIQTMQQQMIEIKTTKDPAKRKALMQQHMQSMHEGMMMVGEMDDAQGKMSLTSMQEKKERMPCQQDDEQCQRMQTIEHHQEGMQERMGMMQQMMDHQSVQADQQ